MAGGGGYVCHAGVYTLYDISVHLYEARWEFATTLTHTYMHKLINAKLSCRRKGLELRLGCLFAGPYALYSDPAHNLDWFDRDAGCLAICGNQVSATWRWQPLNPWTLIALANWITRRQCGFIFYLSLSLCFCFIANYFHISISTDIRTEAVPIFCSHIPERRSSFPSSSRPLSACPHTLCSRCARLSRWIPESMKSCTTCTLTSIPCCSGKLARLTALADTLYNFLSLCSLDSTFGYIPWSSSCCPVAFLLSLALC